MATGRIPTTANSPLTVKGDLFGYSTTQARVPVGNDGETLVADSSTSTGLSYQANWAAGKNKIINGDFAINQRNFTSGSSGDPYGLDRWRMQSSSGCTYSAQTFTPGTAPVAGYEAINFARMLTTGQSGTSVYSILTQYIEDVRTFANQTITISFWAKSASGIPKIAIELEQAFGAGGSPSSPVGVYAGQVTLSTSWTRYSVTVAVPSISGKTIGTTANTSNLGLNLWVSAGTDFNTRSGSLGIQSNTFDIWGVQMEAGSVATAFQTATGTIQGELAACQRYYFRTTGQAAASNDLLPATMFSSTSITGIMRFPVPMRTAATCSFSAAGDFEFVWSAGTSVISGANIDRTSSESVNLRLTSTGLTTNGGGYVAIASGTTKWLEASAEL